MTLSHYSGYAYREETGKRRLMIRTTPRPERGDGIPPRCAHCTDGVIRANVQAMHLSGWSIRAESYGVTDPDVWTEILWSGGGQRAYRLTGANPDHIHIGADQPIQFAAQCGFNATESRLRRSAQIIEHNTCLDSDVEFTRDAARAMNYSVTFALGYYDSAWTHIESGVEFPADTWQLSVRLSLVSPLPLIMIYANHWAFDAGGLAWAVPAIAVSPCQSYWTGTLTPSPIINTEAWRGQCGSFAVTDFPESIEYAIRLKPRPQKGFP